MGNKIHHPHSFAVSTELRSKFIKAGLITPNPPIVVKKPRKHIRVVPVLYRDENLVLRPLITITIVKDINSTVAV